MAHLFDDWPVGDVQFITQDAFGWMHSSDAVVIEDGGWKIKGASVWFWRAERADDFIDAIVSKQDFEIKKGAQQLLRKGWRFPDSAPRDGTQFLADVGYPWAVVCAWHKLNKEWAFADYQIGMVDGEWCDSYFETDYEKEHGLKGWKPLPANPERSGAKRPMPLVVMRE